MLGGRARLLDDGSDGSELPMANMNVIVQSQDGEQTFTLTTSATGEGAVTFNDNPGIVTVMVEPTNLHEGRVAAALWDLIDTHDDTSDDPQYGQKGYGDANATAPIRMSWMLQSMHGADVDSFTGTIRTYFDRLLQNPRVTPQAAAAGRNIMSYNWVARPVPPAEEAPRVRTTATRSR